MVSVTKVGEELHEDLILGHGSIDNFGVETAIVDALEVSSIEVSVSITIEFQESLIGDGLSLGIKSALLLHKGIFEVSYLL